MNKLHLEKPLKAVVLYSRGGFTQNTLRREICVLMFPLRVCCCRCWVNHCLHQKQRNEALSLQFLFSTRFFQKYLSVLIITSMSFCLFLWTTKHLSQLHKYRKMPRANSHWQRDDRNQLKDIVFLKQRNTAFSLSLELIYSIFFIYDTNITVVFVVSSNPMKRATVCDFVSASRSEALLPKSSILSDVILLKKGS